MPGDIEETVRSHVDKIYEELTTKANTLYAQAYLAQLFKNQKKLTEITTAISDLSGVGSPTAAPQLDRQEIEPLIIGVEIPACGHEKTSVTEGSVGTPDTAPHY